MEKPTVDQILANVDGFGVFDEWLDEDATFAKLRDGDSLLVRTDDAVWRLTVEELPREAWPSLGDASA